MEKIKIFICGGHLSPALAIIESLRKKKIYDLYYIGRINALEGDKAESLEYKTIRKINIPFFNLICGRLQRSFTRYCLTFLIKFPISLIQSLIILSKIRPHLIISFGSYVALPVCLVGKLFNIKIITHEQTHIMGFANRIISMFADKICLGWTDTVKIPKEKPYEIIGNPNIFDLNLSNETTLDNFGNKKLPLIYITGGSLGSHTINNIVGKTVGILTENFRILHQTGIANDGRDMQLLSQIRSNFDKRKKDNYKIISIIDPFETQRIYKKADLVIGRSGANTVSELQHFCVPSILIPLPWSGNGEQLYNAKKLENIGLAEILNEDKLSPSSLIEAINKINRNFASYNIKKDKTKTGKNNNATRRMTEIIEQILHN